MSDVHGPARPRVLYLGGFGRSGSTLLERVLAQTPGWATVGELVDLSRSVAPDDERCGCGAPFSSCPTWRAVGEAAFGGWDPLRLARLADLRETVARQRRVPQLLAVARRPGRSTLHRLVVEYQREYGLIYRAAAAVHGAHTLVDSSKGPAHGLALGLASGEDAGYHMSMVNLVRDPRGVAYSWSRRRLDRPQASQGRRQMWSVGVGRAAAQWAALQSEMDLIGRAGAVPVTRIRYEDLVSSPRVALTDLMTAVGSPPGPLDLTHVGPHSVTLGASHGLAGNPSRFRHGTIDLTIDDAWLRALPPQERRLVTVTTWPWLRAYGYPLRGSRVTGGPGADHASAGPATGEGPA